MARSTRPITQTVTVLMLDLAGVVYHWSPSKSSAVSPKILKKLINTKAWHEYESGVRTRESCLDAVSLDFELTSEAIGEALEEAARSVRLNQPLVQEIERIRQSRPDVKIVAISNISSQDFQFLCESLRIDEHFDACFISGDNGMRKPDLRFFTRVLQEMDRKPSEVLLVDDKRENLDSAQALGIRTIHHVSDVETVRQLMNTFMDPVQRASQYMLENAKSHITTTSDNSYSFLANFDQLLILELTGDESLVQLDKSSRTWTYISFDVQTFKDPVPSRTPLKKEVFMSLTSGISWPHDVDTTCVALAVFKPEHSVLHSVLDEIAANTSPDGRVMIYLDATRPRLDPAVAARVLIPFAQNDRLHDVLPTLAWVHQSLNHRAYRDGTYYYPLADFFLFNVARLLHLAPPAEHFPDVYKELRALLRERLLERKGMHSDALGLALRVLASQWMCLDCSGDYMELMALQEIDGGWPAGAFYRLPSSGVTAGTRGLTTAMALYALRHYGL